jgi:hypothetical protein
MSQPQPKARIEFVEREFEGYRRYVEDWKQEHDELARRCWAVEDVISKANYVFECIVRLGADLTRISTHECAAELYVRHQYLFRKWVDVYESVVQRHVADLEPTYGRVEGAAQLRENIDRARVEIDSSRPVTIDSAGNVFELTGEPAIMPGMNPEDIAQGLKDALAGRGRSLKEIIAARGANGI